MKKLRKCFHYFYICAMIIFKIFIVLNNKKLKSYCEKHYSVCKLNINWKKVSTAGGIDLNKIIKNPSLTFNKFMSKELE